MDFTINTYKDLLASLQKQGFLFHTFAEYIEKREKGRSNPKLETQNVYPVKSRSEYFTGAKFGILRHDVDALPKNSLRFARIQAEMGIKGTYYFRIVPQSFDENIIKEIAGLGHEIGYHYETMDTCNGDVDQAYAEFCRNLEKFQKLTDIKTISMHGSPLSKYDNRNIWKKYDYKKLGIIAEPYFDINFNELYYITDTGRRWDGHLYNVRDKATKENPVTNPEFLKLSFHSTFDIIRAIENKSFPNQAMLNFHPQRWNDKPLLWLKELVWQNMKNQGKRFLIRVRSK